MSYDPMGVAPPLTEESLRAAFEKVQNEYLTVCRHVVHPRATGWTLCANCFQPVYVEPNSLDPQPPTT